MVNTYWNIFEALSKLSTSVYCCEITLDWSERYKKYLFVEFRHPWLYMFSRRCLSPGQVGVKADLQLLIQPWIFAPGTHYGWVDRGSVENTKFDQHFRYMTSTVNQTPDLVILSQMHCPLGHVFPHHWYTKCLTKCPHQTITVNVSIWNARIPPKVYYSNSMES